MKVLGVHPDLFYVAFIGQSIVAASQVFILSLPAKLAAVWFGPNQVSSACSIGVFGNQVSVTTISLRIEIRSGEKVFLFYLEDNEFIAFRETKVF